jgi:hypothetical protein
MSERFLFTTIPLADEDKVEKLKDNLGRSPEDDEIDLSYGEIVIDLAEVEAVRQSYKGTRYIEGEAVVYLLGEPYYVQTPYDEVLRLWLDFKEYPQGKAPSHDVGQAIATLARALDEDRLEGSLFYSYQTSIAAAFVAAFEENKKTLRGDIDEVANLAARGFLEMLIKSTK